MQLTVLAVPDCPNALVLDKRLAGILAGRAGVSVSHKVISDQDEAARWGMHGSPTLLIDGVDPFAEREQPPTMSCRLYRDDKGQVSGTPSASQLRQAIEQALATYAAPFRKAQILRELADADFLCVDHAGRITAAYPFSALPTRHRVQIAGNATVFAMCAIDALGISAMVGLPIVIESADPSTGEPITVNVDGMDSTWDPATAVVYVGRTGDGCDGPSASVCCGYMNFFACRAAAAAWAASHPEITGGILNQGRALQVGISIFGELLR